jgi:7-carboxy-7-deazaguanine synthase
VWCDTKKAQNPAEGKVMFIEDIIKEVVDFRCCTITITGGEPLLQKEELIYFLIPSLKYIVFPGRFKAFKTRISIETNGTIKIPKVSGVNWVADWKLPGSGVSSFMKEENFYNLGENDFIKFVVSSEEDYQEAKDVIVRIRDIFFVREKRLPQFAFSPVEGFCKKKLAERMIEDDLEAIFNIQLHKILGVD